MISLFNQHKYIFILLGISIITYFRWISFNYFADGDYDFYFFNELAYFPFNYTWSPSSGIGAENLLLWKFGSSLLNGFFAFFGLGSNISEKLILFWPTIFLGIIFSYFLFKKILKSNVGAFVGAAIFNFNTYYITGNTHFLIYAASPWILLSLLLFISAIERKERVLYLATGLSLFIAGTYDFRIVYIGVFLLFLYSIYHFIFINSVKSGKGLLVVGLNIIIPFLIFGLLNIFWILPTLNAGSLTSNPILDRRLFGNEFLDILYAFTLYHPFWTGGTPTVFEVQLIKPYFWIIPIFAILGLVINRKNQKILFFGLVALIGIFLTKQVSQPFSKIYPWLFDNLFGFGAFREASKFYILIILGYSVLIGSFVVYIFSGIKRVPVYFKYALTLLILGLFIWNVKPIITGEVGGIFNPKEIHVDYLVLNEHAQESDEYHRTLYIPNQTAWTSSGINNKSISMKTVLLKNEKWSAFIEDLQKYKYTEGEQFIKLLNLEDANYLLDALGVKYLVVPPYNQPNSDFFPSYGKPRNYYINELDKLSFLERVDMGTSEAVIYENSGYKPHIYVTDEKEQLTESVPYNEVTYTYINPTEYTVTLGNIFDPLYLNFSESFHPDWKLRVGDFNWFNTLTDSNYFLPDENHIENDAKLNSFYIDPNEVCKEYNCVQNEDGSYDIEMTLYFKPQSYMYLGGIISLTTLVGVLGYLGFYGIRKIKNGKRKK